MPLTLIDEVFYWTVSCLLTKRTWEIDQHMLKNNPEGKYLFGEVCFLSFFAPIALHGTLYGENGPKKSHLERSEQKSSENRPPKSGHSKAKYTIRGFWAIFGHHVRQLHGQLVEPVATTVSSRCFVRAHIITKQYQATCRSVS